MEQQYDAYIGKSYRAMEKTNFCDAVYSPVILILNAVVVAAVMLLSASGNPRVLTFFGMSAGHGGRHHQLYLPNLCAGRELGHGNSNHSVGSGGHSPHGRVLCS